MTASNKTVEKTVDTIVAWQLQHGVATPSVVDLLSRLGSVEGNASFVATVRMLTAAYANRARSAESGA